MTGGTAPALEADGLRKTFADVTAVADVSFEIGRSEFLGLVGPSGCGKTTTLRMLAGLERPDSGTVRIGGEAATDRPARERDTNIVFQDLVLFPHMTVAENVAYGLTRSGVDKRERRDRVSEALELVSLPGAGDRDPSALSGGQKQRVALARALVNDPAVLLLDEPLSSLDRALRGEMRSELKRIQRDSGTAFLYVTHDQESAMSMSDRIGVMHGGRIVDIGEPQRLYERPASRFVAEFLGDAATFRGTVTGTDGRTVTVETPAGTIEAATGHSDPSPGKSVTVAVRPEAISIGAGPFAGTVRETAYKGFYRQATIEVEGGETVTVRGDTGQERTGRTGVEPTVRSGQDVNFTVDRAVLVNDVRS